MPPFSRCKLTMQLDVRLFSGGIEHVAGSRDGEVRASVAFRLGPVGHYGNWQGRAKCSDVRDANGRAPCEVPVAAQGGFSSGRPQMLFERRYASIQIPQTFAYYDVSPDGQRFLMVKQTSSPPH
jgi:hypothetical protein